MEGIRKAPPTQYPPAIRVGDEQLPVKAEPAASPSQASRSTKIGIIWILSIETNSVDSHVDQEGRRCEHGKAQSSIRPSSQRHSGERLSSGIPNAPPPQPDDLELTKEERKAIFEILYMNW